MTPCSYKKNCSLRQFFAFIYNKEKGKKTGSTHNISN